MDVYRIWPTRYCPSCGGIVRQAKKPQPGARDLGSLAEPMGYLVGIGGLFAGAVVAGITGPILGSTVAVALGILTFVGSFVAVVSYGSNRVACECTECG